MMADVARVEKEVQSLSPAELAQFRKWFAKYDAANWDEQLEQDVKSGKLNDLRAEALEEHAKGATREL